MRQKFTPQMSLFHPAGRNSIVKELEQISQVLDANPRLMELVFQDVVGTSRSDTGRKGMTAEQVLRSAVLKSRALERDDVRAEYERLEEEFAFLDEFLQARAAAGMSQAEVAKRMGATQSAVARMESGRGKRSPSLATLRKYAHALGYRIDLRLVKENNSTQP